MAFITRSIQNHPPSLKGETSSKAARPQAVNCWQRQQEGASPWRDATGGNASLAKWRVFNVHTLRATSPLSYPTDRRHSYRQPAGNQEPAAEAHPKARL